MDEEDNKKIPLKEYWTLLGLYMRPQAAWVALLAALLFGGIGMQLLSPQIMRRFIDSAADESIPLAVVMTTALLFVGAALGQQVLNVLSTYLGERVGWAATNTLREDLALHCLELDMAFHNERTPGELIERIDGDIANLASFFSEFVVRIVGNVLLLVGILGAFLIEDWRLALGMSAYAVLTVFGLASMRNMAVPYWKEARQAAADLFGFLEERLAGTVDIRANGATNYALQRLYHFTGQRLGKELKASMVNIRLRYMNTGLHMIGQIAAIVASYLLYREGNITIGTVALILYYTDNLYRPLESLTFQMEELQRAGASVGRIGEILHEESSIKTPEPQALPTGPLSVEFESIDFAYHEDEKVLHQLSFRLEPGKILGLLGRTGSGKTTMARLLFRLYEPQAGRLLLGGIDLRHAAPADLRTRVGMVTQNVQLFRGSVRDNLAFFAHRDNDQHIEQVLFEMGLESWYKRLPNRLDTVLESDGGGLSAGEAQLLTFARVFLRDPQLVLLDEATSRLDPATESAIERAIDKLLENRTAIIIAHRLSTVQRADDILVLEEGRVREHGPRTALAADANSHFSHLLKTGLMEVLQ